MKKIINMVIFIFMIFGMVFPAYGLTSLGNLQVTNIDVSLVNQEPDPAEPGQYMTVRFKIENSGYANAEDVIFEILPEYPFSMKPGKSAIEKVGSVHGKQIGDIGVIIDYELKVDENAVEGDTQLEYRYKMGENGAWVKSYVTLRIRTYDAVLSVEDVSVDSGAFDPGKETGLNIKLMNLADSYLKNIKVSLDLSDDVFSPIKSSNEKTLLNIAPKEEKVVKFSLMAMPDSAAGVYNVPTTITYTDELNTEYSKELTLGLIVGVAPDLSITLDDSDIKTAGSKGTVSIKFVNKGTTDIKFLNSILQESEDYDILSNKEIYIGGIDSDDYESADYDIYVTAKDKNIVELPLNVKYKDANNNDYEENINIPLDLYSGSEAKKLGYSNSNPLVGFLVVIIIIIAGIFVYRRFFRKKKKL